MSSIPSAEGAPRSCPAGLMAEVGLRWCGINAASTERRILTELLSFPAGKHDDQVDALGLVGQLLDKISAGPRPKPPEVTQPMATARRSSKCRTTVGRRCEAHNDIRTAVRSCGTTPARRGVMAQASTLDNVPIEGV